VIDTIHQEVVAIYADPAVADRLDKAGINPVTSTPEEFDAFFRREARRDGVSRQRHQTGMKS